MRLSRKVAIITGAGRGIGKAIAIAFAKEGCDCAIVDIEPVSANEIAYEISSLGRRAVSIKANVSKSDDVKLMVEEVVKKFGRIDILVNNAGIWTFADAEDLSEEDWDRTMDVNLKGAFLCCKAAGKTMIKQKSGKIINIASGAGLVPAPGMCAYNASKAGLISLTKSLAIEWARYNITVNAICPGVTATPMMEEGWKQIPSEAVKWRVSRIPLARVGKPEDIAKAAVFLASSEADYITGEETCVDGGQLALHPGYQLPASP